MEVNNLPTDTFYNLSETKKQNIFNSAAQEFAARRFSETSINQIIKMAGISRGSFYQYFEGKEDLYLYVLTEIGKEKMTVAFAEPPKNADFFSMYKNMIMNILIWVREKPLYYKIGMLMELDDSEFIAKLTARVPDAWASLVRLIEQDKALGRIRGDVDCDMVIQILNSMNIQFVKEYYHTGSEENLLSQVERLFKILRGGIVNV